MSLDNGAAPAAEPARAPDPIVEAAGNERHRNRALAVAGLAAGAVGLIAAGWALFGDSGGPAPAPRLSPGAQASTAPATPLPPLIRAAYAAPDQDAVARAYADAGRIYQAGGASELARTSRDCFERLQQTPAYALLDYCLAFDAFASSALRHDAQIDILPSGSWFGQAPQRGLQVAQAMMGPEGDGSARLLDIRRLALGVGRGRQMARVEPIPAPVAPVAAVTPDEGLEVQVQDAPREPSTSSTLPAAVPVTRPPVTVAEPVPQPRERPRQTAAATARPPARPPAPPAERRDVRRPAPAPRETVLASQPRPARAARPSFSCSAARTASERLVCRNAELARLDRQLNRAFEDAVASGVPRRALRREQDSWLAVRESAADDPGAVADIYALRIEELREMAEAEPAYD